MNLPAAAAACIRGAGGGAPYNNITRGGLRVNARRVQIKIIILYKLLQFPRDTCPIDLRVCVVGFMNLYARTYDNITLCFQDHLFDYREEQELPVEQPSKYCMTCGKYTNNIIIPTILCSPVHIISGVPTECILHNMRRMLSILY